MTEPRPADGDMLVEHAACLIARLALAEDVIESARAMVRIEASGYAMAPIGPLSTALAAYAAAQAGGTDD